jgi:mannose-6-phosphate isomerase-like protein (cupin superfamily)
MKNTRFTVHESLKKITDDNKERYTAILENENIEIGLYAPVKDDLQSFHKKDEIYIIVKGEGTFFNDGKREAFGPGDLFLVSAGAEHRFENFTDDLVAWYIIFEPEKYAKRS